MSLPILPTLHYLCVFFYFLFPASSMMDTLHTQNTHTHTHAYISLSLTVSLRVFTIIEDGICLLILGGGILLASCYTSHILNNVNVCSPSFAPRHASHFATSTVRDFDCFDLNINNESKDGES